MCGEKDAHVHAARGPTSAAGVSEMGFATGCRDQVSVMWTAVPILPIRQDDCRPGTPSGTQQAHCGDRGYKFATSDTGGSQALHVQVDETGWLVECKEGRPSESIEDGTVGRPQPSPQSL